MLFIASPFLNSIRVQNRNHCTTCWILPKAGPKVWFPKVLLQWRSWVGLGVCLPKKSASMSAVFLKGVVMLPNSTCCLQKCFLISMCLAAGLLDGSRFIVIAPLLLQKIVACFILPNQSCCISIRKLRASFVASASAQYSASWELKQAVWLSFTFQLIAAPSKRKMYTPVDFLSKNALFLIVKYVHTHIMFNLRTWCRLKNVIQFLWRSRRDLSSCQSRRWACRLCSWSWWWCFRSSQS